MNSENCLEDVSLLEVLLLKSLNKTFRLEQQS
jgi:hypothetical protein